MTAGESGEEMGDIEGGAAGPLRDGFEECAEVFVARAAAPVVGEFFDVGIRADAKLDEQRRFSGERSDEPEAFGAGRDQRENGGMVGEKEGGPAAVEQSLDECDGFGGEAAVGEPFLGGVGAETKGLVVIDVFGKRRQGGVDRAAGVGIEAEHEFVGGSDDDAVFDGSGGRGEGGDGGVGKAGVAPQGSKGVGAEAGKPPNDGRWLNEFVGEKFVRRLDDEPRVLQFAPRAGAALLHVVVDRSGGREGSCDGHGPLGGEGRIEQKGGDGEPRDQHERAEKIESASTELKQGAGGRWRGVANGRSWLCGGFSKSDERSRWEM